MTLSLLLESGCEHLSTLLPLSLVRTFLFVFGGPIDYINYPPPPTTHLSIRKNCPIRSFAHLSSFPTMSTAIQGQQGNLDRYVVIHVATTCDEHGVYVTKDSAEVIELGWILLDAKTCDEVSFHLNRASINLRKPTC